MSITARQALEAKIASRTTGQLLGALHLIDAIERTRTLDGHERLTAALIADCIEARHGLGDAMDAIFLADVFEGTYTDALLAALVVTGQDVAA